MAAQKAGDPRAGKAACRPARDRDQKKESLAQARLELAERRQKVEVLDRGLGEMERRRAQLGELLVQRQQEIEVWTEQIDGLAGRPAEQRARVGPDRRDAGGRAGAGGEDPRRTGRRSSGRSPRSRRSSRACTETEAAQEELGRHEVKLAESRSRAQFSPRRCSTNSRPTSATVDWKHAALARRRRPAGPQAARPGRRGRG